MRLEKPEVMARHRGVRPVFLLLLALSLSLVVLAVTRCRRTERDAARVTLGDSPEDWFSIHRAHCNAVEAITLLALHDPGHGLRAAGQRAACLAIAGKIDAARRVIAGLPRRDQNAVVNQVFLVAHPVADAGDDVSAGPVMELVLEFQPDQYMALYHAGMAGAIAGDDDRARQHLTRFLTVYRSRDGWTQSAQRALRSLDRPATQRMVQRGGEGSIVY